MRRPSAPRPAPDWPFGPVRDAVLVDRPNRFVARVRRPGGRDPEIAHVGNTGRLAGILVPGAPVLVRPAAGTGRRTALDLVAARVGREWVGVETRSAPALLEAGLARGEAGPLSGWRVAAREPAVGAGRLDLRLVRGRPGGERELLVEVKSVNLRDGDRARFPDAPTARGVRHVRELAALAREGRAAALVFVVLRRGVRAVAPHAAIDPAFSVALADARDAGVVIAALGTRTDRRGIRLHAPLPVELEAPPADGHAGAARA